MKSILQDDKECFYCGNAQGLEQHHIYSGIRRKQSEKWGCKVWLCHDHHTGVNGVQYNARKALKLKQICQRRFEHLYGHERFMQVFGKNYLED